MSDGTASTNDEPDGTVCDECGEYYAWAEFVETIEEFLCERCASGVEDEDDEMGPFDGDYFEGFDGDDGFWLDDEDVEDIDDELEDESSDEDLQ